MKTKILIILLFNISLLSAKNFTCVDIPLFDVDRNNHSTREMERAAMIPQEVLEKIQFITVGEVLRSPNGLSATKGVQGDVCMQDGSSLVLEGKVTDYKKGNRAMRYLVGFGAGKQKIQTDLVLKDKTTGKIIATGTVIDRKIGGLVGGSDDKGKHDYAEKVDKFIKKALGIKTRK